MPGTITGDRRLQLTTAASPSLRDRRRVSEQEFPLACITSRPLNVLIVLIALALLGGGAFWPSVCMRHRSLVAAMFFSLREFGKWRCSGMPVWITLSSLPYVWPLVVSVLMSSACLASMRLRPGVETHNCVSSRAPQLFIGPSSAFLNHKRRGTGPILTE